MVLLFTVVVVVVVAIATQRNSHRLTHSLHKPCQTHSFPSLYSVTVAEDGTLPSSAETWETLDSWKIDSDDDVIKTFTAADQFFADNDGLLKRPSILIHVSKDPNAPAPAPLPEYLNGMEDPQATPAMTMLSFYAFPPNGIHDADNFALSLRKQWKPFAALGRVYVATEGVNAQMSVPTNV